MQEISIKAETTQQDGKDVTVVVVSGYLDGDTAPKFMRAMQELLSEGATRIVLDMEAVPYMSSAGFGLIAGTRQQLADRDGKLVIVGLSDKLRKIFDNLGLSSMVPIVGDRQAALETM